MTPLYESNLESYVISLLQKQGYAHLTPEDQEKEREDLVEVVLKERLRGAIDRLNPDVHVGAREQAFREVLSLPSQNLVENNEKFHGYLVNGVQVEYQKGGETVGDTVWLVDFKNPLANDLVVCDQYTVKGENKVKRPDLVLFVNGLPLVVIELKNPTDENATVKKAYTQLQNYKAAVPVLFYYNGVLVASDGLDAKAGSLTAGWSRFMNWKTVDGVVEDAKTVPQIETLVKGMLRPDIVLDLIKQFSVFEESTKENAQTGLTEKLKIKKIAAYHQYHAVNKAVESTRLASSKEGDKKAGVVWHTQGSGKSLSMVFYSGKIVLELDNPTVVVITDRNDLDDQLFDTFASSKSLLRQEPVQAKDRKHIKELLKTSGGGVFLQLFKNSLLAVAMRVLTCSLIEIIL